MVKLSFKLKGFFPGTQPLSPTTPSGYNNVPSGPTSYFDLQPFFIMLLCIIKCWFLIFCCVADNRKELITIKKLYNYWPKWCNCKRKSLKSEGSKYSSSSSIRESDNWDSEKSNLVMSNKSRKSKSRNSKSNDKPKAGKAKDKTVRQSRASRNTLLDDEF